MSDYYLSDELLERGWRELRSDIDAEHQPSLTPTVVFLGAQPAAGKSQAQAAIRQWYERPMFAVDSDELRKNHPAFDDIMATDPVRMPILTNQAASYWTRQCIDHARHRRLDTIVENTFHNPDVIADSAEQFRAAGYRVHAVVLAVPEELSRLTMLDRYLTSLDYRTVARWTTLAAHNSAVSGSTDTLRGLHQNLAVDRLTILERHGTRHYDAIPGAPDWDINPGSALVDARHAHWNLATRENYARLYHHVAASAVRHGAVDATTRSVFAAVATDARNIAGDMIADDTAHHDLRTALVKLDPSSGRARDITHLFTAPEVDHDPES